MNKKRTAPKRANTETGRSTPSAARSRSQTSTPWTRSLILGLCTATLLFAGPLAAKWPPDPGDSPPPPPPPPPPPAIECPDPAFAGWSPVGKQGLDDHVWDLVATEVESPFGSALFACGNFRMADGTTVNHVAKWDGNSWSALPGPNGIGFSDVCTSLAIHPVDGSLYAGGTFETAGGEHVFRAARWDGTAWSKAPIQFDTLYASGFPYSAVYALEFSDIETSKPDEELVYGGDFPSGGSGSALLFNGLAWSGDSAYGNFGYPDIGVYDLGLNNYLMDLEEYKGDLYAAGSFEKIGTLKTNNIALASDLKTFKPLADGVGIGGSSHVIEDMEVFGGSLYVAGLFDKASGVWASSVARWDGEKWWDVADGLNHIAEGLTAADIGNGSALYATGFFTFAGDSMWPSAPPPSGAPVPAQHVARLQNGKWTSLLDGLGPANNVGLEYHGMVAEPWDDGEGSCLYVGGRFETAGLIEAENIARWCCFDDAFKSARKIHFQAEIAGIVFDVTDDGDGLPETLRCGEEREIYELEPGAKLDVCGLHVRLGTEGDDEISLIDSETPTVVFAGPGNDLIFGSLGDDLIFGAAGNDLLFGDEGDDRLHGGEGEDELDGGRGDNEIVQGSD